MPKGCWQNFNPSSGLLGVLGTHQPVSFPWREKTKMEAAVAADYSQKQHAMYYFTDDTLLEQRRQESPRTGVLGCPGSLTDKWISSMDILLSPAGSYDNCKCPDLTY